MSTPDFTLEQDCDNSLQMLIKEEPWTILRDDNGDLNAFEVELWNRISILCQDNKSLLMSDLPDPDAEPGPGCVDQDKPSDEMPVNDIETDTPLT